VRQSAPFSHDCGFIPALVGTDWHGLDKERSARGRQMASRLDGDNGEKKPAKYREKGMLIERLGDYQ
jgi:hypothetical protein